MSYCIRKVAEPGNLSQRDYAILDALDKRCFPNDPLYPKEGIYWWLVHFENEPIGFCGLEIKGNTGFLCRAGVVKTHRGSGLQKKMIKIRERYGRILGLEKLTTYTVIDNYPSMNSLVSCGFRFVKPDSSWDPGVTLHYQKIL